MKWFFALLLSLPLALMGQGLRVMEWNVENLFDCTHDSLKNDLDFTPEGSYRWTPWRLRRKVEDIAKVIYSVGSAQMPALVGLCEVENEAVMLQLTRRSPLAAAAYRFVVTDSPDQRGVDVALLYDPTAFNLLGYESVRVPSAENGLRPTRDILHAWGIVGERDTLHVVVVHLPSRTGGRPGAKNRMLAAKTLASLLEGLEGKKVICMGDFNAPPRDPIFRELTMLHDLVPTKRHPSDGTYRYKGLWQWIDHILLSPALYIYNEQARAQGYSAPWLQEHDARGGWHPRRTYLGPWYKGGVSDHVPIWADIRCAD